MAANCVQLHLHEHSKPTVRFDSLASNGLHPQHILEQPLCSKHAVVIARVLMDKEKGGGCKGAELCIREPTFLSLSLGYL